MSHAYIYDHLRTPRGKGKKDGSLHQATPTWLLRTLLKEMERRNELDTSLVDDVVRHAKPLLRIGPREREPRRRQGGQRL